jgi:hypothetical protein
VARERITGTGKFKKLEVVGFVDFTHEVRKQGTSYQAKVAIDRAVQRGYSNEK